MILAKLKHHLVTHAESEKFNLPEIPVEIPCNVCSKDIGLKNVYRKHSDSGSWLPLERDIFLNKFMKAEKSAFLKLEENTGLISSNPHLNQRFVKEEVFREDILLEMGFDVTSDKFKSVHSPKEGYSLLSDLSKKVLDKKISTRNNRGKVLDVLDKGSQKLINKNKENDFKPVTISFSNDNNETEVTPRQTRRTSKKSIEIFGGKLYLKAGDVNSLYRDIDDLYTFYNKNRATLSDSFPSLIRMAMRLLCELAANASTSKNMANYITNNFAEAKKNLDTDLKTTLSAQNVTENSMIQLFVIAKTLSDKKAIFKFQGL
jgi:hypothetical protein